MSEYEIDVCWNGEDYAVDANLSENGAYSAYPANRNEPAEVVVINDPQFIITQVVSLETGEPIEHPDSGLVNKAVEILEEIWWDRELNG